MPELALRFGECGRCEVRARIQAERADAEATATRRLVGSKRWAPATKIEFKPGSG